MEEAAGGKPTQRVRSDSREATRPGSPSSLESSTSSAVSSAARHQQHGDKTKEVASVKAGSDNAANESAAKNSSSQQSAVGTMATKPGEVAFFKLLHAEFKKATHFFDKAQQEFTIREERVREGMEIMKRPNSIMVNGKWSLLARSLYRLYKDLLLLETFAIMTYCSFSKILKKHDKVTGYNTRQAFMANVVNKANFTSYPVVLQMINRCEQLYEEVSQYLVREGKEGLYEDERLFINMIHRLNEQCMDAAEGEGVPERQEVRRPAKLLGPETLSGTQTENKATSSLRTLMAEMHAKNPGQVSEGAECEESDNDRKRSSGSTAGNVAKKQRSE